jgi:uncharacterized membrane protein YdjX (TVP38/TMEM64 family)
MRDTRGEPVAAGGRGWRRFIPLALLLLGMVAFFAFGLQDYISCGFLRDHREGLAAFIDAHEITAVLLFMALYATVVAFSLPVAAFLTFAGGFLFGLWSGTVYVVIAATIGATALFLAARSAMGHGLRGRAGPAVARMEQGFREHAFSYLLFLRLTPLFPFWLVNLVAAVVGIPLRSFTLATFIGIIPASFIYVGVGNGVSSLFETGETCNPRAMISAEVVLPLIGLAVLSLVPDIYKKLRRAPPREGKIDE